MEKNVGRFSLSTPVGRIGVGVANAFLSVLRRASRLSSDGFFG
jgi:hypothetical protein